jgi:DNA-damage-inducible protein J
MNTVQTHDSVVRARIDAAIKARAVSALADKGLSVSDAIRLLLVRVADERRLPFAVKAPNATTRRAIAELEAGGGYSASTVKDFMAALNEDD